MNCNPKLEFLQGIHNVIACALAIALGCLLVNANIAEIFVVLGFIGCTIAYHLDKYHKRCKTFNAYTVKQVTPVKQVVKPTRENYWSEAPIPEAKHSLKDVATFFNNRGNLTNEVLDNLEILAKVTDLSKVLIHLNSDSKLSWDALRNGVRITNTNEIITLLANDTKKTITPQKPVQVNTHVQKKKRFINTSELTPEELMVLRKGYNNNVSNHPIGKEEALKVNREVILRGSEYVWA